MRKWIIAGIVVLLLVAVAGVALLNLNRLINRNKDYLVRRAQEALRRNITVGNIGVTLWGGIGVRVKNFSMADDPAFEKEPFVRAEDLQVNMKLLPLLRKEFEVSQVILRQPVINIIKDQNGEYNFSTLGREKTRKQGEKEKTQGPQKRAPPAWLVSLINIDGGRVDYTDRSEGIDFRANNVDLKISNFNFDNPVDVKLAAAVFGAGKQNLSFTGRIGPLASEAESNKLPIAGDLNLDPVSLANLEKTLPGLKQRYPQGFNLAGAVGSKAHFSGSIGTGVLPQINGTLDLVGISARVPQLPQPISDINTKVSFTGRTAELPDTAFRIGKSQVRLAAKVTSFAPLNLAYQLSSPELNLGDLRTPGGEYKKPEIIKNLTSNGTVSMKDGAWSYSGTVGSAAGTISDADYTNLQTSASFFDRVATIENLQANAFGGSLAAKGSYDMRQAIPRFAASGTAKGMDLTQITHAFSRSPQHVRGSINMNLDITGAGKDWNTIQKALKGHGKAEVIDGALLDVNLADSVLSGVTGISNAAHFVPQEVRNKYPAVFNSKDTEFKQLSGSATISDGKARTDDLVISAADFKVQGKGWLGFDHTVDFRAMLLLSEKLSQDIVGHGEEMKGLANSQGRLEIPFNLSGKLPGAKPVPDIGYVAQAIGKGAIQRGLEGFFNKRSSKGGSETSPEQEQKPSESQQKGKVNPQKEILERLQKSFGR